MVVVLQPHRRASGSLGYGYPVTPKLRCVTNLKIHPSLPESESQTRGNVKIFEQAVADLQMPPPLDSVGPATLALSLLDLGEDSRAASSPLFKLGVRART